jgi:2-phosphosulfolactate phosphatase
MSIVVCEWGPEGARKFDGNAGAIVIVDVLSFSTSIEDLIGAGAVIEALGLPCSPEAEIAREIFFSVRLRLRKILRGCASGQELISRGYAQDVEVAIDLNASIAAPLLANGAYIG